MLHYEQHRSSVISCKTPVYLFDASIMILLNKQFQLPEILSNINIIWSKCSIPTSSDPELAVPNEVTPVTFTLLVKVAEVPVLILSVDATPVNPEPLPVIIPVTVTPLGLTTNDAVPPATTPT